VKGNDGETEDKWEVMNAECEVAEASR
jgi:hypothetical protein